MDSLKVSYVNWAIDDKTESSAALVPGTQPGQLGDDSKLSASGKFIKAMLIARNPKLNCGAAPPPTTTQAPATTAAPATTTKPAATPAPPATTAKPPATTAKPPAPTPAPTTKKPVPPPATTKKPVPPPATTKKPVPPPATTKKPTPPVNKCTKRPQLIAVVKASNQTVFTNSLNAAVKTWTRNEQSNFAAYKKRIENIIYTNQYPTPAAKLAQIEAVITGFAPATSAPAKKLMAVPITGFGTIAEFVKC